MILGPEEVLMPDICWVGGGLRLSVPSVLTTLVLLEEREFEELSVLEMDTKVPDLPLTLGLWARCSV